MYKLLLVEDDSGIAVVLLALASGVRKGSDWLCRHIEKMRYVPAFLSQLSISCCLYR